MKGTDIADALSVNPLAEFAYRPDRNTNKVVRVRGLQATEIPGAWLYTQTTDPVHGHWLSAKAKSVTRAEIAGVHISIDTPVVWSRELVTVEDAERELKSRQHKNAAQFAANAKLDRIVDTLQRHGVEARRALGGVLVRDTVALGRLLARLP